MQSAESVFYPLSRLTAYREVPRPIYCPRPFSRIDPEHFTQTVRTEDNAHTLGNFRVLTWRLTRQSQLDPRTLGVAAGPLDPSKGLFIAEIVTNRPIYLPAERDITYLLPEQFLGIDPTALTSLDGLRMTTVSFTSWDLAQERLTNPKTALRVTTDAGLQLNHEDYLTLIAPLRPT